MAKRRNLKKEKQERNRAYARKFKKRKMRNDGRGEGAGNGDSRTCRKTMQTGYNERWLTCCCSTLAMALVLL